MPVRCLLFQTCLYAVLVIAACSSESRLGSKTDESTRDTVSLKQISNPSFQAAHPIKIDASVIALVLNGILVRNNEPTASGAPSLERAFAVSEVGHLAPLISESLRRADSDQQIE